MANDPSAVVKSEPRDQPRTSTVPPTWVGKVAALLGVLVAVGVWTQFLSSDPLESERKKLKSLPARDRERVSENSELFAALSPEERERVRGVAAYVEAQTGTQLARVKKAIPLYQRWVNRLSTSDFEAIESAGTVAERKAAVELVLAKLEASQSDIGGEPSLRGRESFFVVPAEKFPALTEILERAVGRDPQPERDALIRATEILADAVAGSDGVDDAVQKLHQILIPSIAEEIIALRFTQGDFTDRASDAFRERSPASSPQRIAFYKTILATQILFSNLEAAQKRALSSAKIGPSELRAAFDLVEDRQDELLDLPTDQFRSRLTMAAAADAVLRDDSSGTTLTRESLRNLMTVIDEVQNRSRQMFRDRGPSGFRGGPRGGGPRDGARPQGGPPFGGRGEARRGDDPRDRRPDGARVDDRFGGPRPEGDRPRDEREFAPR